jgi:serine acetyltransferase
VVIREVAPMSTVVGVPAREIKSLHGASETHSWAHQEPHLAMEGILPT